MAPMSGEQHTCPTCGTVFVGNYCPRCGQSAKIGRYSFKKAFLLFLDVWGLGNRGMFHTLRDLLLRPGYMIRDYLSGMQMAYFPPFKMFFLLSTLSILVSSGLNIKGENSFDSKNKIEITTSDNADELAPAADQEQQVDAATAEAEKEMKQFDSRFLTLTKKVLDFQRSFPTFFSFLWLVMMSVFLYPFFRKSPAIPDLRYSEFLISMVYIANMNSIYSVVLDFLCNPSTLLEFAIPCLSLLALKQLSGFSGRRTTIYTLLALLFLLLTIVFLIIGIVLLLIVV